MNVNLSKWGETTLSPSLAISFEFVISWTNAGEDLAQIARITAGAIGIAYPHKLPKYRAAVHRPNEYGHICLNALLEAGIPTGEILRVGTEILQFMTTRIPSEQDVESEMDFLEPEREDLSD